MKAKRPFTKPAAKQKWGDKKISLFHLKDVLKYLIAALARLEAAISNENIENVTVNLYTK